MDAGTITKLLESLGVKEAKTGGGWVMAPCPLSPWTHANGKDSNPSFGIKINKTGESYFNCFVCESGSLFSLVQSIHYHHTHNPITGRSVNLKAALELISGEDVVLLPDYDEVESRVESTPWPETALSELGITPLHEESKGYQYLKVRGVSDAVIEKLGVAEDVKYGRVVFPIRNAYGQLCGARGRSYEPTCAVGYRHFDYSFEKVSNTNLVWFNEEALNDGRPVVIVEGQFDACRVMKTYPVVMAILTAKASARKLSKLAQSSGVLFMLDNDPAGRMSTEKMLNYLSDKGVPCGVIEYPPEYKDPDSMPDEEIEEILSSLL